MKIIKIFNKLHIIALLALALGCENKETSVPVAPDLLYANGQVMHNIKADYQGGADEVAALIGRLVTCADAMLELGPYSVMDKSIIPPSGDKHDYISQGPYWWPDSTKENGLPYIRRDGVVNPERSKFTDRQNLHDLIEASELLSKAYFFTEDEKYAIKASNLLKTWFIDDSTRMNPNLEFGQGIPGITEGRGIGIIETRSIGKIADAITLIRNSESWNTELEDGMQKWLAAYLDWLISSEKGQKESVHPNNHGTWYDVQAISLALFTEQDSLAKSIAEKAKEVRLDEHIMADGSQPRELARTVSFNYSAMNLAGLFHLAYLAQKVDVDLWAYKNAHGAGLEDALRFLIPAAVGQKTWEYEQIRPINGSTLKFHLFLATKIYNSDYLQIANKLPDTQQEMDCDEVGLYFY
jgi:hypothetical protein